MEIKVTTSTEEGPKVYKEKPYFNSNKDPLGITLKGTTKAYLVAHENIKAKIVKNKVITTPVGKIRILEVNHKPGFINAIVEVSDESEKGNAEIKVYNPSLSKKKGATIEMRKCSDFDYWVVERLKDTIASILDKYLVEKDSHGCQIFTCDICKWQTRFEPALKGHKKRMHDKSPAVKGVFSCKICKFSTATNDLLVIHTNTKHKSEPLKRQKSSFTCDVTGCESTFYYERNLREHKISQHTKHTGKTETLQSPASSPPRKRLEKEIEENEADMLDLDEMEIIVEKEMNMKIMLEKRIKELETQLQDMLEERKEHEKIILELRKKVNEENTKSFSKQPVRVLKEHLQYLKGFKWRFPVRGDGRCLENCTAIHKYGNEDQGIDIRTLINHHVAENFQYWKTKLPLPYKETIYIGGKEKIIEKKTEAEMIEFLKHDEDALKIYSGGHTLNAIANVYNIKIHIFTYTGGKGNWNVVLPDPEVASPAESEMFLYHSNDNHYDLLINDNRSDDQNDVDNFNNEDKSEDWETVKGKSKITKRKMNPEVVKDAKAYRPDKKMDKLEELIEEELSEELVLEDYRKRGYKRTTPQESSESVSKTKLMLTCKKCDKEFESQGFLVAHMVDTHKEHIFKCDDCDLGFKKILDLEMHKIENHEEQKEENVCFTCMTCGKVEKSRSLLDTHMQKHRTKDIKCDDCGNIFGDLRSLDIHRIVHMNYSEFNCNDCAFQASDAHELINHLKILGHQPSENIKDKCKMFVDYKQCYTCKLEFDGYWNLMEHRKDVHPSRKRCKYYPDGKCLRGTKCWFVHEEQLMDVDESFSSQEIRFKCNFCDFECKEKNALMKHKKSTHKEKVPNCNNFLSGNCKRNDANCWYNHMQKHDEEDQDVTKQPAELSQQVFQTVQEGPFPPDPVVQEMLAAMNKMYQKLEAMAGKMKNPRD